MPDIYIDRVDQLSCREERGVVRSLVRKARIQFTGLDRAVNPKLSTYDVLSEALNYLATLTPSVAYGSVIGNPADPTRPYANLVLIGREPQIAENDPAVVDVILTYQHLIDGANQRMFNVGPSANSGVPAVPVYGRGKTSVVDKTTNFYYPPGVPRLVPDPNNPNGPPVPNKAGRVQILVSHKFPLWETGIAATPFDPKYPRTVFQGGEISIPYPQTNFHFEAIVYTNNPKVIGDDLVAKTNGTPFMGDAPTLWLCSEVAWEVNDSRSGANPLNNTQWADYKMTFEFQKNSDGWDTTVAFHDSRTGRPPAGVMPATIPDPNPGRRGDGTCLSYYNGPEIDQNGSVVNTIIPLVTPGGLLIPAIAAPAPPRPAGIWDVPALERQDFVGYLKAILG